MALNFFGLIVVIILVFLGGWLTFRLQRIKSILLRWVGTILVGLFSLVFLLLAVVLGRGLYILYAPHRILPITVAIANTPEQVARGEHLAASICAPCHSLTGELPLSGGKNLSEDVKLPLGDLIPPNLTPAGPVKNLSDADLWRIFRHGVFPNGRQAMMPVNHLQKLSDDDLQAIIAYVRSQPPVEHSTPPINPSLLMAFFLGTGTFNVRVTPVTGLVNAPPKGPTAEYGTYIVSYNDCTDCHGVNLDGHPSGPTPPGPNLRLVQHWTAEQFINTLRTGVNPGGYPIRPPMPWKSYGKMDDEELTALYLYLKNLPPEVTQK